MAAPISELTSPVTLFGNPLLRTPAVPVKDFSSPLLENAKRMGAIMQASDGVGIAAQQCGLLCHLALVAGEGDKVLPLVNARITEHSEERIEDVEGCLSLPGLQIVVPRWVGVRIEAQDLEGESFHIELQGQEARIAQHELDHLAGRLIFDYLPVFEKIVLLEQIRQQQL